MADIINTGNVGGGGQQHSNAENTFKKRLASATSEDKQVNPAYIDAIRVTMPKVGGKLDESSARYTGYTDGVFDCYYLKDNNQKEWFIAQFEFKLDVDLNNSVQLAKVLIQVLHYMKKFEIAGLYIPKVIVLGTKLNCMAIPASYLYDNYIKNRGYAFEDENKKEISASVAPNHPLYAPLKNQLANDTALLTYTRVIEVSDKNTVRELCIDIIKAAKDIGITEDITEATLSRAFDYFDMKVLDKKSRDGLTSREKAELFMTLILTPEKVTQSYVQNALGNKVYNNTMIFNGQTVYVEPGRYNSFLNLFAVKKYEINDQKKLTAITDRLIEDTDRRRKGDFYTPTIWVDEAHKLMDKNLGDDWRDKYIVWDCAWGTGNLTRDYKFSDLYCSTIQSEDLTIGAKYNPFATKFQYDFLNDDVDLMEQAVNTLCEPFIGTNFYYSEKIKSYINFGKIAELYSMAIEKGITTEDKCTATYVKAVNILKTSKLYASAPNLVESLLETDEDKKKGLVFLINPPYGTSKNNSTNEENNSKAGIALTAVRDTMDNLNLGMAQRQLYAQFLFRCQYMMEGFGVQTYIGAFSQSDFLTTVSYGKFRDYYYSKCKYIEGFQFSGGYFDAVSDYVGLTFTLWESNNKTILPIRISIADIGQDTDGNFNIDELWVKNIAPVDNLMNVNIRNTIKKLKKQQELKKVLALKSGLNIKIESPIAMCAKSAIGGFQCNSNDVNQNSQRVCLFSSQFYGAANMEILPETFNDAMALFTARRLIKPNWINWKDEYMDPDKGSEKYIQFQNDSIVYSLFESKSQQTSIRDIQIDNINYNIFNEFFWISRQDIYDWAIACNNQAVIDDVLENAKSERFVYKKLKTITLSDDAKLVLDYATTIVKETMRYREDFNMKHPEYHINTWDAGWYQIKAVAKEYMPDKLKLFNEEYYKTFEDRLRPLVYELGFLYK